jgi:hypothetical protein
VAAHFVHHQGKWPASGCGRLDTRAHVRPTNVARIPGAGLRMQGVHRLFPPPDSLTTYFLGAHLVILFNCLQVSVHLLADVPAVGHVSLSQAFFIPRNTFPTPVSGFFSSFSVPLLTVSFNPYLFLQIRNRRNQISVNKPTTPKQLVQSQLCRVFLLSTPCPSDIKAQVSDETLRELVLAAGTSLPPFLPPSLPSSLLPSLHFSLTHSLSLSSSLQSTLPLLTCLNFGATTYREDDRSLMHP